MIVFRDASQMGITASMIDFVDEELHTEEV
jgi:hypothetical protein